ncbi:ElyC/SanA/YdcF family protein [Spiribacter halobius]|nr:ElyC/SanA/YdcF family protein [Spiribacter halobius]UEX77451.1 YdcF family protein [Spiribacter halobius]
MTFFLTKILGAVLMPLPLILLGLVLGLGLAALTRWRRCGLAITAAGTLALALLSWWPVADRVIGPLESAYPALAPEELPEAVPAVIVLGAGSVWAPELPVTSRLSATAVRRLTEGVRLWRERPEARFVVSGWGAERPEAELAAGLLQALGLPAETIHALPRPRNTEAEAMAYAALELPGRPVLVTSAAHMPRAVAAFRAQGIEPIPAPTDHRAVRRGFHFPRDFTPQARDLETSERAWHEYLGRSWAWVRGLWGQSPTPP